MENIYKTKFIKIVKIVKFEPNWEMILMKYKFDILEYQICLLFNLMI